MTKQKKLCKKIEAKKVKEGRWTLLSALMKLKGDGIERWSIMGGIVVRKSSKESWNKSEVQESKGGNSIGYEDKGSRLNFRL